MRRGGGRPPRCGLFFVNGPRRVGRAHAFNRIDLYVTAQAEPAIEASPGGQHPGQRTPPQPTPVQLRDEAPDMVVFNRVDLAGQLGNQPAQDEQITPVIADCMRRLPSLLGELVQIETDKLGGRHQRRSAQDTSKCRRRHFTETLEIEGPHAGIETLGIFAPQGDHANRTAAVAQGDQRLRAHVFRGIAEP